MREPYRYPGESGWGWSETWVVAGVVGGGAALYGLYRWAGSVGNLAMLLVAGFFVLVALGHWSSYRDERHAERTAAEVRRQELRATELKRIGLFGDD